MNYSSRLNRSLPPFFEREADKVESELEDGCLQFVALSLTSDCIWIYIQSENDHVYKHQGKKEACKYFLYRFTQMSPNEDDRTSFSRLLPLACRFFCVCKHLLGCHWLNCLVGLRGVLFIQLSRRMKVLGLMGVTIVLATSL